MRFVVVFLALVCLVCSSPVERADESEVENVDPVQPEMRDIEGADGVDPQRRFPVVILETPMFRPVDDDEDFDSDDDGFDNYPLRPQFSYNDYFRRMEQQMEQFRRFQNFIENVFRIRRPMPPPRFPPGFFDFDGFGNFSDLPPNYDNSTYTTKNINGTIVAVNETIKKVNNNESSFVFHVKTVQVIPENETTGGDDGLTVQTGEEDLSGTGGQGSVDVTSATEGPVDTSSEPSNVNAESSEPSSDASASSSASPVSGESTVATTESVGGASAGSGNATDDPSANDVNLARRFRR